MVSSRIVAVQKTTFDEFPYLYSSMLCHKALVYLASPFGKGRTVQVKAASCTDYSRLPYDICLVLYDSYAAFLSQWLNVSCLAVTVDIPTPPAFLIMSSPATNSLFSCFAESTSGSTWGETLKAFIFSLNNSGGFPPFKCFAKNASKAIYKNSSYGPSFGEFPGLRITSGNQNTKANAQASISKPYSVPFEVENNKEILAGTSKSFIPDSYEVFYLA